LRRLLFARHKSGRKFFEQMNSWGFSESDVED
jgi:hypothetical protein